MYSDKDKFIMAMDLLQRASDVLGEKAPDTDWWKDYFRLTGEHMVLTEEGWMPASCNTKEVTGEEPMEVLDEVNA